jgi:hypothetical protein
MRAADSKTFENPNRGFDLQINSFQQPSGSLRLPVFLCLP